MRFALICFFTKLATETKRKPIDAIYRVSLSTNVDIFSICYELVVLTSMGGP